MKKITKNSKSYYFVFGLIAAITGLILYPLFDIVYCKFITNSTFVYSAKEHIVEPLTLAIVLTIVVYGIEKRKK